MDNFERDIGHNFPPTNAEQNESSRANDLSTIQRIMSYVENRMSNLQLEDNLQPSQVSAVPIPVTKEWHQTVTPDIRNRCVQDLVQAMSAEAIKIEAEIYKKAISKCEYYYMMATQIQTSQVQPPPQMQSPMPMQAPNVDSHLIFMEQQQLQQRLQQAQLLKSRMVAMDTGPANTLTAVQLGQSITDFSVDPVSRQALQQLCQTLKNPVTPEQQKTILQILKSNPSLMAAFIKHRQQQQSQQQIAINSEGPTGSQQQQNVTDVQYATVEQVPNSQQQQQQ